MRGHGRGGCGVGLRGDEWVGRRGESQRSLWPDS